MKKIRLLAAITFVAGFLLLAVTFLDFLALTDIRHDYVSPQVLDSLNISLPSALPEWTDTRGEWQVVALSLYSRVGFLVLNSITLWFCIRRFKLDENVDPQLQSTKRDIP